MCPSCPSPGTYCTKTVMGRSILLTRGSDGRVRAFDNVCLHRQSQIVSDCGSARRLACPYHSWTYDLDGNLVGVPGKEGFPETSSGQGRLTELPATECAGFLWISLDRNGTLDIPSHLGPLADELDSWGIGRWAPLGEKVLDCPINWKLAIDTFAENYHFATVHKATFATIARSNCTVFDSFGQHHRLVFPLNGILDLEDVPEEQWEPLQNMVVIYALFPNIVLSCDHRQRRAVPHLSRRTCRAGRSPCTRTRRRWMCPTNPLPRARRRSSTTHIPRCATRTTRWSNACRPIWRRVCARIWCSAATSRDYNTAIRLGTQR